jgi:xylan 1,4-beta-xylosidase
MMVRQYQGLIRAGYFDGPNSTYRNLGSGDLNSASAQDLALRVAQEGVVVLKNDGFLPNSFIDAAGVAMIGFWADDGKKMLGGYSGGAPYTNSPVYAAKKLGIKVNYATGPIAQAGADNWTNAAMTTAKNSASIIFFAGIDNTIEKEQTDRRNISWPAPQLDLVQKLTSLGKPIVIVKMGTHIDDTPLLNTTNIRAIVWAGYPGQDGGTAVMNVLTGAFSPSGRLPITMYPSAYVDKISITNMTLRPSGSNPGRTYRWYNTPVFPFGHGLSYTKWNLFFGSFPTSFSIQDLLAKCTDAFSDLCPFPDIPITVANTGSLSSDFVVLAFVSGNYGPIPYPIKTLATYQRLFKIAPGQSQNASLSIILGDLSRVDLTGSRILVSTPSAF